MLLELRVLLRILLLSGLWGISYFGATNLKETNNSNSQDDKDPRCTLYSFKSKIVL